MCPCTLHWSTIWYLLQYGCSHPVTGILPRLSWLFVTTCLCPECRAAHACVVCDKDKISSSCLP